MKKVILVFFTVFIAFLLIYFGLPVLNYGFFKLPFFLLLLIGVVSLFFIKLKVEDFIWVIHGSFHTIRERNLKRIIPDHSKQSRSLAF